MVETRKIQQRKHRIHIEETRKIQQRKHRIHTYRRNKKDTAEETQDTYRRNKKDTAEERKKTCIEQLQKYPKKLEETAEIVIHRWPLEETVVKKQIRLLYN